MVVVDTSAVIAAMFDDPAPAALLDRLADEGFHAPHLVDVEFTHAVRRLVRTGEVSLDRAELGLADFAGLMIVRYPHGPLRDRMWVLRDNLTAYDAAFVALSEALEIPLITTDARLAASPGHQAVIETY